MYYLCTINIVSKIFVMDKLNLLLRYGGYIEEWCKSHNDHSEASREKLYNIVNSKDFQQWAKATPNASIDGYLAYKKTLLYNQNPSLRINELQSQIYSLNDNIMELQEENLSYKKEISELKETINDKDVEINQLNVVKTFTSISLFFCIGVVIFLIFKLRKHKIPLFSDKK